MAEQLLKCYCLTLSYFPLQISLIICLIASILETVHFVKGPMKTEHEKLGFHSLPIPKQNHLTIGKNIVFRKFTKQLDRLKNMYMYEPQYGWVAVSNGLVINGLGQHWPSG